jgi:hypothetical protein
MPPPKKYEEHLVRGKELLTQLDFGAPGASAGDVQVFESPFFKKGKRFSFEGGVCVRVRTPDLWHCVVTHKWPWGDLTIQLLQDFTEPSPWRFAIIGGSGAYEGAHGEVTYWYNGDKDPVQPDEVTFRFSTR